MISDLGPQTPRKLNKSQIVLALFPVNMVNLCSLDAMLYVGIKVVSELFNVGFYSSELVGKARKTFPQIQASEDGNISFKMH